MPAQAASQPQLGRRESNKLTGPRALADQLHLHHEHDAAPRDAAAVGLHALMPELADALVRTHSQ